MEDGVADGEGEGKGKRPVPEGEKSSKRKMKSAYQLEVLEQSYAGLCGFDSRTGFDWLIDLFVGLFVSDDFDMVMVIGEHS